jgi:hypothetical protein
VQGQLSVWSFRDTGYKNKNAVILADTDMLIFEDIEKYSVEAVFNKSVTSLYSFDLIIESFLGYFQNEQHALAYSRF